METTYRIETELNIFHAEKLLNELKQLVSDQTVILDLTQVQEIDYAGIQLLLSFQKSLLKNKGKVILDNANDNVISNLKLAGAAETFEMR